MDALKVNDKIFTVIELLGKGKGGYSYLVQNDKHEKFVVKKIHHEPCDYYKFGNKIASEISDYHKLHALGIRMPIMYDVDTTNETILKEYIEGETIYNLVKNDAMDNSYIEQVKDMCQLLYPANTNIDYFPTNFVVNNGLLYYVDYECNPLMEEWNFENWGVKYWSKTIDFLEYAKNH